MKYTSLNNRNLGLSLCFCLIIAASGCAYDVQNYIEPGQETGGSSVGPGGSAGGSEQGGGSSSGSEQGGSAGGSEQGGGSGIETPVCDSFELSMPDRVDYKNQSVISYEITFKGCSTRNFDVSVENSAFVSLDEAEKSLRFDSDACRDGVITKVISLIVDDSFANQKDDGKFQIVLTDRDCAESPASTNYDVTLHRNYNIDLECSPVHDVVLPGQVVSLNCSFDQALLGEETVSFEISGSEDVGITNVGTKKISMSQRNKDFSIDIITSKAEVGHIEPWKADVVDLDELVTITYSIDGRTSKTTQLSLANTAINDMVFSVDSMSNYYGEDDSEGSLSKLSDFSSELKLSKGIYKIEAWGASGGGVEKDFYTAPYYTGGKGGYSVGVIDLTQADEDDLTLYINYGTQGRIANIGDDGHGENGGGKGVYYNDYISACSFGYGGGGASDVRIKKNDLENRIVVAGGGGGAGKDNRQYTDVYNKEFFGGNAGGFEAECGYLKGGEQSPKKAKLTVGYAFGLGGDAVECVGDVCSEDAYSAGGGGGGWFGGFAGESLNAGGGGGSSFVLTKDFVSKISESEDLMKNSSKWENFVDRVIVGNNVKGYYYLTKAEVRSGDQIFPTVVGSLAGSVLSDCSSPSDSCEAGHKGDGAIRITRIINDDDRSDETQLFHPVEPVKQ